MAARKCVRLKVRQCSVMIFPEWEPDMSGKSLSFFTAALCAVIPISSVCAAETGKKPNVIFLFADDQRADTIGALGNPHIKTPNLDQLVHRGFVFRNAYCLGSNMPAV